jgi:phosphoribosyl-ATP pyrophosphohydrolase
MDDNVLKALYETVLNRRDNKKEGSYTCYLLDKGLDKILKKVGEECSETIIAAKNGDNSETVYEISDLIYHLMVMMVDQGIELDDVLKELDKRSEKTGNLKTFHQVDKNS